MLLYLTDSYCTTHATISPLCHSERSGITMQGRAQNPTIAAESNPEGAPAGGISALVYGLIAERIPLSTGCEAARCNNSPPPKQTKTSPESTRPCIANQTSLCWGGCSWGKFGEVKGGLEGENPVFQDGVLSLQGLPFSHFVSSSSTSSANISATVGLCSTGFGVTSPALIKAHLVRDGPTNS